MTVRRVVVAIVIVAIAAVSAPAAVEPGVNSADLICILAPFALLAVFMRRPKTPVEVRVLNTQTKGQDLDGFDQEGMDR
ncbi:MAG: hypothetical protein J0I43_01725 [Microbacterium sp.]|uniref:hypothetical protein n=1 Tax=Microbacterium sp. TaxID=51671 RepID=UPI001AC8CFCD|nr:hypothetical protein [Microbacterium sp.]MBN9176077.1 hypothetical protein [Microbacterium sp.]